LRLFLGRLKVRATAITDHREFLYSIKLADQAIYDRVLPAKSILWDVSDWNAFVPIPQSYHFANDGAPGYSLLRLLKLEFLKYFYRLSDRQVIERTNSASRMPLISIALRPFPPH